MAKRISTTKMPIDSRASALILLDVITDFEFEDGSHVTRLLNVDVPYERSPVEWNTPVMG